MRAATGLRTGLCRTGLWILIMLVMAGCAVSSQRSEATPAAAPGTSLSTLLPSPTHFSATSTSKSPISTDCGYQWANQALMDLTNQVQAAVAAADLQGVNVLVEAFGENCLGEGGTPVSFIAMQTDFYLTFEVASLEDTAALGQKLAEALAVLAQFPPESTPGPMPGKISVRFTKGENEINFPVRWQAAQGALAAGLTGQQLWDDLNPKNLP